MNGTQAQVGGSTFVGFLAGVLAGKGTFGLDAATWAQILGALGGAVAAIWAAVATRKAAIVTQAANLPEVHSIRLDPSAPGANGIDAATPNNVRFTP